MQGRGFRWIEALVITLIATIAGCFAYELFFAQPLWREAASGLLPTAELLHNREMLYLAIGILGATVMPHNLYLHSSIVQTRAFGRSLEAKTRSHALCPARLHGGAGVFAFFINAAILILGAAAFHHRGMTDVADIGQAYQLLTPVMGASLASTLFAAALLCSGQNSTLTGTLAGQIVMEGFLQLAAEALAAATGHAFAGDHSGGAGDRHRRRKQGHDAAHPQPGDPQLSAAVCGGAAGAVHQRQTQDGRIRQPPWVALWRGLLAAGDHRAECLLLVLFSAAGLIAADACLLTVPDESDS